MCATLTSRPAALYQALNLFDLSAGRRVSTIIIRRRPRARFGRHGTAVLGGFDVQENSYRACPHLRARARRRSAEGEAAAAEGLGRVVEEGRREGVEGLAVGADAS